MIIAIDGPAGSGKSTIAKLVALELGFEYLDTGAMYRMVTLRLVNKKISLEDIRSIEKELKNMKIDILNNRFFLNNVDVTDEIRTPIVSENVSKVAKIKEIRYKMVELQREISKSKNTILDGRDIGTVVLPHADLKIYQIASVETRAKRRYLENKERGLEADLETIKKEIEQRDYQDMHRAISPLKKADDAIELDTSNMTLEEVVDQVLTLINKTREE